MLAWGNRVSTEFVQKVRAIAASLVIEPSWLMACMAFESAETFRADIRNAAGSGAIGLIQFMPSTAAALGTTTDLLAKMRPEEQLSLVARYFAPWARKLNSLGDVYGVILWPAMIGKPDDAVIFNKADPTHPKLYIQNRGLDFNKDGLITKSEIVSRVQAELTRGMSPANVLPN